jgi:hypothetical protein
MTARWELDFLETSPSAIVVLVSVWPCALSLIGHRSDEEGLTQDGQLGDSIWSKQREKKIARDAEFKFNLTKKK